MSFLAGATALMGLGSAGIEAAYKAPLAYTVGLYALKQQYNVLQQQVALGQRAVTVGETFESLTESQYSTIATPVYTQLQALFDRYVNTFEPLEVSFVQAAFKNATYTVDCDGQRLRVSPLADQAFDDASLDIVRQTGTYASAASRYAAPVAGYLAIERALAKSDAVNRAYRYEESERVRWWLQFYWKQFNDGAKMVEGMSRNTVGGLNHGASASQRGIHSLSGAYSQLMREFSQKEGALANMASYWGSISNGAMEQGGFASGGGFSSGITAANANQVTPGGIFSLAF